MKEKIMYLILGILIGAVITAGCFLLFTKNNKPDMNGKMGERPDFENMTDEEREEMMEKRGDRNFNGEMPNGEKPEGAPEENENSLSESETTTVEGTSTTDTNNSTASSKENS